MGFPQRVLAGDLQIAEHMADVAFGRSQSPAQLTRPHLPVQGMDRCGAQVVQQHEGGSTTPGEGGTRQDEHTFLAQPLQQWPERRAMCHEVLSESVQDRSRDLTGDLAAVEPTEVVVVVLDLAACDDVADDVSCSDTVVDAVECEPHRARRVGVEVPASRPGLLGGQLRFGRVPCFGVRGLGRPGILPLVLLAHRRSPAPPKVMSPWTWFATSPWLVPRKSRPDGAGGVAGTAGPP